MLIAYDADTAGQAATVRGLDLARDSECQVRVLALPARRIRTMLFVATEPKPLLR